MTTNKLIIDELNIEHSDQMDELITQATELKNEVKALVKRYEFKPTNLKLHDVATHNEALVAKYTPEYTPDAVFNTFTEDAYFYEFLPLLDDEGMDTEHIGRSSSFHIVDKGAYRTVARLFNRRMWDVGEVDVGEVLDEMDAVLIGAGWSEVIVELGNGGITDISEIYDYLGLAAYSLNDFSDEVEDYIHDIEVNIKDFKDELRRLEDVLKDIAGIYEYIERYKANQVAHYNTYLKGLENDA